MWHGKLEDRRYSDRQDILSHHAFNPEKDIALDEQGLWKWSSNKPRLHEDICSYFISRKEDG